MHEDGRRMYIYMNKHVPFSVAVETVVAGEMTQSSSHESQSAETHNERRHVTHTHTRTHTHTHTHCVKLVATVLCTA